MMTTLVLAVLIIGLGLVVWKVIGVRANPKSKHDTYVCPVCNEHHCDCHKESKSG